MFQRDKRNAAPAALSGVWVVPLAFESPDDVVRRFKKIVAKSGILGDFQRHVYFIPKPELRRLKRLRARLRRKKGTIT